VSLAFSVKMFGLAGKDTWQQGEFTEFCVNLVIITGRDRGRLVTNDFLQVHPFTGPGYCLTFLRTAGIGVLPFLRALAQHFCILPT